MCASTDVVHSTLFGSRLSSPRAAPPAALTLAVLQRIARTGVHGICDADLSDSFDLSQRFHLASIVEALEKYEGAMALRVVFCTCCCCAVARLGAFGFVIVSLLCLNDLGPPCTR